MQRVLHVVGELFQLQPSSEQEFHFHQPESMGGEFRRGRGPQDSPKYRDLRRIPLPAWHAQRHHYRLTADYRRSALVTFILTAPGQVSFVTGRAESEILSGGRQGANAALFKPFRYSESSTALPGRVDQAAINPAPDPARCTRPLRPGQGRLWKGRSSAGKHALYVCRNAAALTSRPAPAWK